MLFSPESVGEGLITILKQGHPGSVWVCENNNMVYEVEIETMDHYNDVMQKVKSMEKLEEMIKSS